MRWLIQLLKGYSAKPEETEMEPMAALRSRPGLIDMPVIPISLSIWNPPVLDQSFLESVQADLPLFNVKVSETIFHLSHIPLKYEPVKVGLQKKADIYCWQTPTTLQEQAAQWIAAKIIETGEAPDGFKNLPSNLIISIEQLVAQYEMEIKNKKFQKRCIEQLVNNLEYNHRRSIVPTEVAQDGSAFAFVPGPDGFIRIPQASASGPADLPPAPSISTPPPSP